MDSASGIESNEKPGIAAKGADGTKIAPQIPPRDLNKEIKQQEKTSSNILMKIIDDTELIRVATHETQTYSHLLHLLKKEPDRYLIYKTKRKSHPTII